MARVQFPALSRAEAEIVLADVWCELVEQDLGTPELDVVFPNGKVEISLVFGASARLPEALRNWVEQHRGACHVDELREFRSVSQ
jgi:hypothetical protein